MYGIDVRLFKELLKMEEKIRQACSKRLRTASAAETFQQIVRQHGMKVEESAMDEAKALGEHPLFDTDFYHILNMFLWPKKFMAVVNDRWSACFKWFLL